MATLARSLRAHPLKTSSRDAGGAFVRVRLDDRGLAGVLAEADGDLAIYRDFPAAEAAFYRGDSAPLARLAAEAFANGANGPAIYYSAGLDAAVECHDYPQLFDPAASPAGRLAQIAAGLARLPADAFSPFDKATWFGADLESYDWCVNWPQADPRARSGAAAGRRLPVGADAHPRRRPRPAHVPDRRAPRRGAVPEQHARGRAEHRPRHGARRLDGVHGGHRAALRRAPGA